MRHCPAVLQTRPATTMGRRFAMVPLVPQRCLRAEPKRRDCVGAAPRDGHAAGTREYEKALAVSLN